MAFKVDAKGVNIKLFGLAIDGVQDSKVYTKEWTANQP